MMRHRRAGVALALGLSLMTGCVATESPRAPFLLPADGPSVEAIEAEAARRRAAATTAILPKDVDPTLPIDGGPRSLELEAVLASVERSFPLLDIAAQERIIAQAKELEAMGEFDLKIKAKAWYQPEGFFQNNGVDAVISQRTGLWGATFYGGYRMGRGDFDPTFDGKRFTNHGGELNAGVILPLLRGGRTDEARTELARARLGRRLAEHEVRLARIEFLREAVDAYWGWVAAGRNLAIKQALLDLAERRQGFVQRQVDAGALPEIEGIDNERLVATRRGEVQDARRKLEVKGVKLSLFIRDEAGAPIVLNAEEVPVAVRDPLAPDGSQLGVDIEQALDLDPLIRALSVEIERVSASRELYDNQLLPTLDGTLHVSEDLNDEPSKTKEGLELKAGLEFMMPVQRRKARGKLQAAEAKLRQLRLKRGYARDKAEARVRAALWALQTNYERHLQARRGVDLAARVASAERIAFEEGESDILKLNLREEYLAKARMAEVEALIDYWQAVADYRAAVLFDL